VKEILQSLKILSDGIRLKIVCLLAENELCVCELMEVLNMSQSRISNHLRILKTAGIIEAEREGKWIFYSLAKDTMDKKVWEIIQTIVDQVNKGGYLAREKKLAEYLISKRGEPGHCPILS